MNEAERRHEETGELAEKVLDDLYPERERRVRAMLTDPDPLVDWADKDYLEPEISGFAGTAQNKNESRAQWKMRVFSMGEPLPFFDRPVVQAYIKAKTGEDVGES